jgi:hypothetical protein
MTQPFEVGSTLLAEGQLRKGKGGMRQGETNPFFVARIFLYGTATGLLIALVLWFIDSMLSHRLGEIVWGR